MVTSDVASGHPLLDLTVDEVLTTTRTVRRRLDTSRPVARATVEECLRLAFQAPTGGNAQNWAWIVVDDPDQRCRMADLYRRGLERTAETHPPRDERPNDSGYRMPSDSQAWAERLEQVPVLVVPAYRPRYGLESMFAQGSAWGSLLPAVWSFMLALRSRGLGSAWTTSHLHYHTEMAECLGIPSGMIQGGLFPVAYTEGTDFKPANRSFSESRIFWNEWRR